MMLDTCNDILSSMQNTADQELLNDVRRKALRYAGMRAEWAMATPEQRMDMDAARTRAHDAVIDSVNILCRNMSKEGLPIDWRKQLGDDRKVIGDFACGLYYQLSISAR